MLSEEVFVKDRLNAIGYDEEMLHQELLPLVTEMEDKQTISRQDNALICTAATKM